ncbi:MAG: hypothetical protein KAS86_00175 [Candidatus Omnitrophica bacterium]|nr:hypothetical protein [Candidatus Omnitrophota bacterium]
MKKVLFILALVGLFFVAPVSQGHAAEVLFDFEDGLQGWEIPDWAYEKPDHGQKDLGLSDKFAKTGKQSMELTLEFPGDRWMGGIIEIMQYYDWTDYSAIAVDVYLPEDAPHGLKAKLILTVGDTWKWAEMSKSFTLVPGEWVTLSGDLTPGSIDWRRIQVDDSFRQDVRKIDIRIASNGKPAYSGPVYIDNVRVIE